MARQKTPGGDPPSSELESALFLRGLHPVAGVDEAGRGPLAGPVVAAAVILPAGRVPEGIEGLDDSKKLSPSRREELFAELTASPAIRWAIASVEPGEIDRLNILRATHEAMRSALLDLLALPDPPAHALVDGLPVPGLPVPHTAVVGGDGISLSIAAASVLAKVARDRMMGRLDAEFPQYGFSLHKGYPTPLHLRRLREHGPCPHHRRSFGPVAQHLRAP